jgi:plasmid stabilization system protein ParE
MKRLHVSEKARREMIHARLYIAEHNPRAATRFWKKMRARWQTMRRFP